MIILDTNVVLEFLKVAPAPQVEAWLSGQDGMQLCFTAVGEAELRRGVAILPVGQRRRALAVAVDVILEKDLQGRILPSDRAAASTNHERKKENGADGGNRTHDLLITNQLLYP